jgi:ComF family protein
MIKKIYQWLKSNQIEKIYTLLHHQCALCLSECNLNDFLCQLCLHDLPYTQQRCSICANIIHSNQTICGRCTTLPPYFDQTYCLYSYQYPVSFWIHQIKQYNQEKTIISIARAMTLQPPIFLSKADAYIFVPSPLKPCMTRGFNPAKTLCEFIASVYPKPILENIILPYAHTAQKTLNAVQRNKEIKHHFYSKNYILPAKFSRIILIDDVMTTGVTASYISFLLKQLGVKEVYVWCIARA